MNNKIKNQIFKNLSLIRRSQEELIKRYHPADQMRCPMHFCIGQELMPAVLGTLMIKEDSVFTHHRSHGYYIAKKGSINEMIAEFYGKASGTTGGLAGSQELSYSSNKFFSGTILSGMFSVALGTAFAQKNYNKKNVSVTVIGDGGMEEGIVYETLNLASLKSLPILFICENNNYSTHTPLNERTLEKKPSNRAKSFNMETSYFEGNDPDKLFNLLSKIIKKIRITKKPQFIEIKTYRYNSHVGPEEDDHYNYRNKKEINNSIKKDALNFYLKKMLKKNKNFLKIKNNIDRLNKKTIEKAFKFAEKSSFHKEFQSFNFKGTYKNIKKFYDNKISFGTTQEKHKPKPY